MATCPTCKGSKHIDNGTTDGLTCDDCLGTGKRHKKCSHCDYGRNPEKTIRPGNDLCYYCRNYSSRIIDN